MGPKIHTRRYAEGGYAARKADAVARAFKRNREGDYTPSQVDFLSYIRDRRGIAALVAWQTWYGNLYIGLAWTRENRRHQGLYRRLIEHLRSVAAENHLKALDVGVSVHNARSKAVHQALGFHPEVLYFSLPCRQ